MDPSSGYFVSGSRSLSREERLLVWGSWLQSCFVSAREKRTAGKEGSPAPLPAPFPHPVPALPATMGISPPRKPAKHRNLIALWPLCSPVIRPVIKGHVLLCWLGGEFLLRAGEIGSELPCPVPQHGEPWDHPSALQSSSLAGQAQGWEDESLGWAGTRAQRGTPSPEPGAEAAPSRGDRSTPGR